MPKQQKQLSKSAERRKREEAERKVQEEGLFSFACFQLEVRNSAWPGPARRVKGPVGPVEIDFDWNRVRNIKCHLRVKYIKMKIDNSESH